MEKRIVVAGLAIVAVAFSLVGQPAKSDTISERGSVSQTVKFRIVIPELPPLVMTGGSRSLSTVQADARSVMTSGGRDRQVAHVIDRHGRHYLRQTSESSFERTVLLAAP